MKQKKAPEVPSAFPPLLVSIRDASQILGCSIWAMRNLLWAKKLPFVEIGRRYLIDPEDLRAYVERNKAVAQ